MSGKTDVLSHFALGKTYFNGGTTDSTSGAYLEGEEFEVEFRNYSNNPAADYGIGAGNRMRLKVVRNASGAALLPGFLVRFKTTAGHYGSQVDGSPATTAADFAGVVDPWLPAAGVPANDLFHIVIEGPCPIMTSLGGNAENVFSAGDPLVAITAATSQATTAGRVIAQTLTGATALLANQVQFCVGVAMSASTTAETNTTKLVYIKKW